MRRDRRHHQGRPARLAQRHARRHRQAGPRRLSRTRRQSRARAGHLDERADGGAARPRQRAIRRFESRIHLDRYRQPGRQSHPGRGARALQRPLQRSPQPDFAQDADREARRRRGGRAYPLAHRLGALERRFVRDRAGPVRRSRLRGDQGRDRKGSRSSRPPAAPRTRASSRTIARCSSSAWSGRPCTRSTSAPRSPISRR